VRFLCEALPRKGEVQTMPEPTLLNGAYRLLRSVDAGATARVYLAEEVATGAMVAVKVLRKELADEPEFVSRFEREATLLQQLDHPNLVKLIELVHGPEGMFLLLEWAEGTRLDQLLREQGPFASDDALSVLRQLADALGALHAAGIVHRDLKPENLMVEKTAWGYRARLLDLGIARFADPARAAATFQTLQGLIAGTPTYLSPEQILARPATPACDVYAFGVLAFVVLTGKPPFEDPTQLGLMQKHLDLPAPRLKPRDPALARHPIVKLVARCLEKDPADRPVDGAALLAALSDLPAPSARRSWFKSKKG
jgi:serine/threonine-protein kinase